MTDLFATNRLADRLDERAEEFISLSGGGWNPPLDTPVADQMIQRLAVRGETFRRKAIRETDWSETAVLHIIEYQPQPAIRSGQYATDDRYTLALPEFEAKRYSGQAPHPSEYADGKRTYQVQTVTKPLLDQLADEYPDVFDDIMGDDE